jgi:hypothetical protein
MNANDRAATLAAIEARLAELDEESRERERAELLAEIDRESPLSDSLRDRIARFAAVDLERAERMPEGAYTLAARRFLADLLARSGLTDVMPGWTVDRMPDGPACVYAKSFSRGRVCIGEWDGQAVRDLEREELERARAELIAADGSRAGLTRDRIIVAILEARETDGTWPTQAAVAESLGLADARRIRQVQGPGRWPGVIADAKARLAQE